MEKEQERKNIIESLEKELEIIKTKNDLANLKALYLGKNGIVTNLSLKMKDIPNEEKREYGKFLNEIKDEVSLKLETLLKEIERKELEEKLASEKIDITLPSKKIKKGSLHPMTKVPINPPILFLFLSSLLNQQVTIAPFHLIIPCLSYLPKRMH